MPLKFPWHKKNRVFSLKIRNFRRMVELDGLVDEIGQLIKNKDKTKAENSLENPLKTNINHLLKAICDVKQTVQRRHEMRRIEGASAGEMIRMQIEIERNVAGLDKLEIDCIREYQRQTKNIKLHNAEELEKDLETLNELKRQVEQCKELVNADVYGDSEIRYACDFATQMEKASVDPPTIDGVQIPWRELNENEGALLEKWAQKDADIDAQILNVVGAGVDALAEIADVIGEKAAIQKNQIEMLGIQAEYANEDLMQLNAKLEKALSKGMGGSYLIPRIGLTLLLAVWGVWIFMLVKARI